MMGILPAAGMSEGAAALWQTVLTIAIVGGLVWGWLRLLRHRYWGPRVRAIFRRPLVILAVAVGGFMVTIAVLDSVRWVDPVAEDAKVLSPTPQWSP